jgi:hypothetical protein
VGEAEVVFAIDHAPGMNHPKEALEEAVIPCTVWQQAMACAQQEVQVQGPELLAPPQAQAVAGD